MEQFTFLSKSFNIIDLTIFVEWHSLCQIPCITKHRLNKDKIRNFCKLSLVSNLFSNYFAGTHQCHSTRVKA